MKEKTLLVTGFEPFGGKDINMSWEAAAVLPEEIGADRLVKRKLPTVFRKAGALAIGAIEEIKPDAVICLGEAGGQSAVTPELVALNLRFGRIPDNEGQAPRDEVISEGGENALFSTLPARKMAEAIAAAGKPGELSLSAGLFVCNDVMYQVLEHLKGSEVPMDFIHVPADGEMTAEEIAAALTVAIESIG